MPGGGSLNESIKADSYEIRTRNTTKSIQGLPNQVIGIGCALYFREKRLRKA
jgi:hypothetical protein